MARVRSIHPAMWHSEDFICLSDRAKLLLLCLGNFTDYANRFRWADAKEEVVRCGQWSDAAMSELLDARLVVRNGDMGEVLFRYGFARAYVSKWEAIRSAVFERDGWVCTYCGSASNLHCDHVLPVSRGGTNEMDNLTTACGPCNTSKGDKTPDEWRNRRGA